jgi:hypothetical protein
VVALPTEVADEEGYLRRTIRNTRVNVYAPQISYLVHDSNTKREVTSRIYEMGIPVVEIDLPWNVEIMQKIPLNSDRDNITPAYAREVSVAVINEMHKFLRPDEVVLSGVQEALADSRITVEAVKTILTHQHGEKRAAFDPRKPESNAKAFQAGYDVIAGRSYSKEQWENIRRAEAAPPSSFLFPVHNPYSDNPDDPKAEVVPEEKWTPGMKNIADYAKALAGKVLKKTISIRFESRSFGVDLANYGNHQLCFNLSTLGQRWFDNGITESVNDLLIHELAHEYGTHLTEEFDNGMSQIGAKMTALALAEPEFFKKYGMK